MSELYFQYWDKCFWTCYFMVPTGSFQLDLFALSKGRKCHTKCLAKSWFIAQSYPGLWSDNFGRNREWQDKMIDIKNFTKDLYRFVPVAFVLQVASSGRLICLRLKKAIRMRMTDPIDTSLVFLCLSIPYLDLGRLSSGGVRWSSLSST